MFGLIEVFYAVRSNGYSFWTSGSGILKSAVFRSLCWVMKLTFTVVLQPEQEALCYRPSGVITLVGNYGLYSIFFPKWVGLSISRVTLPQQASMKQNFKYDETDSSNTGFLVWRSQKSICYFKLNSECAEQSEWGSSFMLDSGLHKQLWISFSDFSFHPGSRQ